MTPALLALAFFGFLVEEKQTPDRKNTFQTPQWRTSNAFTLSSEDREFELQ